MSAIDSLIDNIYESLGYLPEEVEYHYSSFDDPYSAIQTTIGGKCIQVFDEGDGDYEWYYSSGEPYGRFDWDMKYVMTLSNRDMPKTWRDFIRRAGDIVYKYSA